MVDVSILYCDPRGPYPKMGLDCWDETRDARLYAGPNPVVAHPPCGPWGAMSGFCTKQDASCAPLAVQQVRRFGGVLEHPVSSRLWGHSSLPLEGEPPDAFGGRTFVVNQLAWGHACSKPTRLYVVGLARDAVADGIRTGGTPTHQQRARHNGKAATEPYKMASAGMRRRTPIAFAEWLVSLARQVRRP